MLGLQCPENESPNLYDQSASKLRAADLAGDLDVVANSLTAWPSFSHA
jgi:hypothetical protein